MNSLMIRVLLGALLGAAVTGCAHHPESRSVLWWPQGPGTTAEELTAIATSRVPHAAAGARYAETSHSSLEDVGSESQSVQRGDLIIVSGLISRDENSASAEVSILEDQVRSALDNAMRILESHGLSSNDIVSVTLYTRDVDDLEKANAAYTAYFQRDLPARAIVGVDALPAGSQIDIAVVARK
jgi:2-iminobutanoate/2-iminopropanoate deaminase